MSGPLKAHPSFLTPLELEYIDGRNWRVTAPFVYRTNGDEIAIPSGFITDFASIPRIFWNILPPTGNYGKAAVVHDLLYRCGGRIRYAQALDGSWTYRQYSRAEADGVLRDAMTVLGVGRITRGVIYGAVRAFGVGFVQPPPPQDARGIPLVKGERDV